MLFPDFKELMKLGHKARRLDLHTSRKSMAAAAGNYRSPFRGQGLEFHEVRDYRPGDDVRNIDWRVTARTNRPHMKIFTEERERTIVIAVDCNASMRFGTRGTFKSIQAARVAALLGWQAQGSNDRVGCLVFGDVPDGQQYFAPARSRRPLWRTLKLLSSKKTGYHKKPVKLDDILHHLDRTAPTGALIFLISDFAQAGDGFDKRLSNLHRRCDIVLVAVNDPADRIIPVVDTVKFSDIHDRKIAVDTTHKFGRDAYTKLWTDQRRKLQESAAKRGIGLVEMQTDQDAYNHLARAIRRIRLGKVRR